MPPVISLRATTRAGRICIEFPCPGTGVFRARLITQEGSHVAEISRTTKKGAVIFPLDFAHGAEPGPLLCEVSWQGDEPDLHHGRILIDFC